MKTCASCLCYRPSEEDGAVGECRLMPPVVVYVEDACVCSVFPEVESVDYCAQWDGVEQ